VTSDDWFDQTATVDVLATIRWLRDNGFAETRRTGGSGTSFGNVALTYASAHIEIMIARDRGEWELHLRFPDCGQAYGIGLVSDVRRGVVDWTYRPAAGFSWQLPAGVLWESELPRCLSWIDATEDATGLLETESGRRAEILRQRRRPPPSD
jgi:hypothetical protein